MAVTAEHVPLVDSLTSDSDGETQRFGARIRRRRRSARTASDEAESDAYFKRSKPGCIAKWFCCCFSDRLRQNIRIVVEDWIFLGILGVLMALLSYVLDQGIEFFQESHLHVVEIVSEWNGSTTIAQQALLFLTWTAYTVVLVTVSVLLGYFFAPTAVGSGIPEMKTILRGVLLKEYLTAKTLATKVAALVLSLGSGLIVGKEGPFVHIGAVLANVISKVFRTIDGAYANESGPTEMLVAGCAVGVACTFSAPIGGVLLSVEVTNVYFAVRNYWRGFFAATFSATIFRILYRSKYLTVLALYQTNFPRDSFLPQELPLFALIGALCGVLAAGFVFIQRQVVCFLKFTKPGQLISKEYWLIFPFLVSIIVSFFSYPYGFGKLIGGEVRFSQAGYYFFNNCSLVHGNDSELYCGDWMVNEWTNHGSHTPYLSLLLFFVVYYCLAAVSYSTPVPAGIFVPSFIIGGAMGRFIGEIVATYWTDRAIPVFPGVYSVVAAAAFCGGVTHAVSVGVIMFEVTGQLVAMFPVMIAILVANAVASYLQPSIYDSLLKLKKLPYVPDIPNSSSNFHGIKVEQFMLGDVVFISQETTYGQLEEILDNNPRLPYFPVVTDNNTRTLVGSCSRTRLQQSLESKAGESARYAEAARRTHRAVVASERETLNNSMAAAAVHVNDVPHFRTRLGSDDGVPRAESPSRFTVVPSPSGRAHLDAISDDDGDSDSRFTVTVSADNESCMGAIKDCLPCTKVHMISRYDLAEADYVAWRNDQLLQPLVLTELAIDPAPFQVSAHSSLFRVHSLFLLLGLNRAYVTQSGRLVGVVSHKELRKAVENVIAGKLRGMSPSTSTASLNDPTDNSRMVKRSIAMSGNDNDTFSETDDQEPPPPPRPPRPNPQDQPQLTNRHQPSENVHISFTGGGDMD